MTKENIAKILESDNIDRILSIKEAVSLVEKSLIEQALKRAWGNQVRAAKILRINRNTIRSKIKKFGIDVNKWKTG